MRIARPAATPPYSGWSHLPATRPGSIAARRTAGRVGGGKREEEKGWERGRKGKVKARKEGGKVRVITPWLHTSPWEGKERSKERSGV